MKKKIQGFTGTVVKQIYYDVYIEVEIDEDDPAGFSDKQLREIMLEKAKSVEKYNMEEPYMEEYEVEEDSLRMIH